MKNMPEKKKKSFMKRYWLLILLILFLFFYFIGKSPSNEDSNSNKLASLQAEINIVNEMMIDIINRNTYEWTNVKIVANDYYTCIEGMTLEPNRQFDLKTYQCKDSQGQGSIGILTPLEKIKIITDEGSKTEYFTYG